ncbi:MAG: RNA polymerase sigma factor [Butyrivibrio sp.]|nr:RNA polymerase sigma factor [Butyrivibrio sp.]
MEDEEIVELYWNRRESAVKETQIKYGKYLFGIAKLILGNAQDAEECVNDTYFSAWNSIPPTRPEHLMAYLSKISRNAAVSRIKYNNAGKRMARTEPLDEEIPCKTSVSDSVEAKQESKAINQAISAFLDGLNAEKNAIFVRRFWGDESIKTIAREMNVTESKVKMTIMRLKLGLRKQLEKAEVYL